MPRGEDKHSGVYSISVIARLTGLHEQTIRQYERLGLLTPQRTPGGTRSFSEDDLERLKAIARLTREMGVNLAGVEVILRMREHEAQMLELMRGLLSQLDEAARARLEAFMRGVEPGLVPVGQHGLARPEQPQQQPSPGLHPQSGITPPRPRKIEIKGK